MQRIAVIAFIAAGMALAAGAQTPVSTIQSTGKATVDTSPEYVDFWFHKRVESATFAEAMKSVLDFGPALRKKMAELQYSAFDLTLSGPALPNLTLKEAWVSARVRFTMNTFSNIETGPGLFAALCDDMAGLSETLECSAEGPFLNVGNPKAIEQTAVGLATEDALPIAQATAELMNAQIAAVEHVDIEECVWNEDPEIKAAQPDMRRLTCTARVHITYAFSVPGQ
ncbi:MAG: hypothetical protein QG656_1560 [Candidatus Hydrogenedentes bacterium]|nr:hypothetical protein [Candidatus Hydrogenedentota bacterium]